MANIDFKIPCWYKEGCNRKEYGCERICHRYMEMNHLINNCGMKNAHKYLKALSPCENEVDAYMRLKHIKEHIKEFVEKGGNLYITSNWLQTGKTSWALKLLYKYFDEIWAGNGFRTRGYFIYVPEFLQNVKMFEYKSTQEYKTINNVLKTADLVVWDDITGHSLNEQEQNILNLYIDKRMTNDKANIFTGITIDANEMSLQDMVGSRLATRITTNCETVLFEGPSRVNRI